MSDNQLKQLLEELNFNPKSPRFILRQISENVFWGKVWFGLPWEKTSALDGANFYFIESSDSGFIGIAEASFSEIHVYLLPHFRKKGIMSNALRKIILPHMFWHFEREQLKITIDEGFHGKGFKGVENSALLAGFTSKKMKSDRLYEYTAYKNNYLAFNLIKQHEKVDTENELKFLHQRINSINTQLQYLKERYEVLFCESEEVIDYIKDDIRCFENDYVEKISSISRDTVN